MTASCATSDASVPASRRPSCCGCRSCWSRWRGTRARSPAPSRRRARTSPSPNWWPASTTARSPRAAPSGTPPTRGCATTSTRTMSQANVRTLVDRRAIYQNEGMARSIWSGAISFGLVNVPIKLYSAVSKKTVRFHQLNGTTGNRIQQKRVDPETGDEVNYEDIVKGYELTRDRYVIITPEELETLDPEKTRSIDIEDFVDESEIDPIFYDHPYYLVPDKGAAKAYGLLLNAMADADKVAIARVVIRSKEQLVAIRPHRDGDLLVMETMVFADEVVGTEDIDELPDAKDLKVSERELKMARQLIESLTDTFDPGKYKDEYREKVLELIEAKADGQEIAVQPAAEEPAKVPDLMAALEASLAAVRSGDDDGEKPKKKSSSSKSSKAKETAKS